MQDVAARVAFPPDLLGRYEPIGLLGAGGMGIVFLATHRGDGSRVAIKLMLTAVDSRLRQRFAREAAALQRVRHPHVVGFREYGESEQGPYLVMDAVEGASLARALPPGDPVPAMVALARGIEEIHRQAVIHRDIKPSNVLFDKAGRAVLIDFGIALDQERTHLTSTGGLVGTPVYLAPELVRSGEATPAVDWYGWSACLYFACEGSAPYGADDLTRYGLGQPLAPPRFARLDPGSALARLLVAGLSPDPADRPASADEIGTLLAATGPGFPRVRGGTSRPDPDPAATPSPTGAPPGAPDPAPDPTPGPTRPGAAAGAPAPGEPARPSRTRPVLLATLAVAVVVLALGARPRPEPAPLPRGPAESLPELAEIVAAVAAAHRSLKDEAFNVVEPSEFARRLSLDASWPTGLEPLAWFPGPLEWVGGLPVSLHQARALAVRVGRAPFDAPWNPNRFCALTRLRTRDGAALTFAAGDFLSGEWGCPILGLDRTFELGDVAVLVWSDGSTFMALAGRPAELPPGALASGPPGARLPAAPVAWREIGGRDWLGFRAEDGSHGLHDGRGIEVVPARYEALFPVGRWSVAVKRDGAWGILAPPDRELWPHRAQRLSPLWATDQALARDAHGYALLDLPRTAREAATGAARPRLEGLAAPDELVPGLGDGRGLGRRVAGRWVVVASDGTRVAEDLAGLVGPADPGEPHWVRVGARWQLARIEGRPPVQVLVGTGAYDEVRPFAGGLAAASREGRWSYVDRDGRERVSLGELPGSQVGDFPPRPEMKSQALAAASPLLAGKRHAWYFRGDRTVFLEDRGPGLDPVEVGSGPRVDEVGEIRHSWAPVRRGARWAYWRVDAPAPAAPFAFDAVRPYTYGVGLVTRDGRSHFVDDRGARLYREEFEKVGPYRGGWAPAELVLEDGARLVGHVHPLGRFAARGRARRLTLVSPRP